MTRLNKTLLFHLIFLLPICYLTGQTTVSGTITSVDGEPLIGVNVRIKGTNIGAISDLDGKYSVSVPDIQNDTLTVSYIGYATRDIPIAGRSIVDVTLREELQYLEEVVVVGYGTVKKEDLTGAVSILESESIQRIATGNAEQALQGKIAGVQVTPSSGEPGAGAVVRIRGTGTLNDASPIYVIDDGLIVDDISFLNPSDIETVTVLKDASATAIYGSRGANGVIIVTTKQGNFDQKARITVNAFQGYQVVADRIELTNARNYAILTNELAANTGTNPPFANPESLGDGTDWQDVIFQTAPMRQIDVGVTGGSETMSYSLSADFFQQEGVIRGGQYDRFTLRANNQYKPREFLSFGHNASLIYIDRDIGANVLNTALRTSPVTPVFDSLGNFGDASVYSSTANAEASIFYNDGNHNEFSYRAVGNAYMDVKFLKYFTYRINFGLDYTFRQDKNFTPTFNVSPIQQNIVSDLRVDNYRNFNWLWDNLLTFAGEWGDHRVSAVAGITGQEFNFERLGGLSQNLLGDTPEFFYLDAGEEPENTELNTNNGGINSLYSTLFRVNYIFRDRYFLTASWRSDNSSKFGANFKDAQFPSFSLAWTVSNEPFFKNQNLLSRLKIRGGWGIIGNEKIDANAAIALVEFNNLNNAVFGVNEETRPAAIPINLANPDLRWEETSQTNVGVEFGLLENRFIAEVDYYNKVTDDILVRVPIPGYVGSTNDPIVNAAKVLNRGWEFNLQWREKVGEVNYSIGAVASTVYNEVQALGGGNEPIFAGGLGFGGVLGTRTDIGLPIGSFYGFKVDGVFQNEEELNSLPKRGGEVVGDIRYLDFDGFDENGELIGRPDGKIDAADRTIIGSPIPDFIYGFNAGVNYKGFSFNIEFNGQAGNEVINAKQMSRFGNYNYEVVFLDRWNGEGTSDFEPRITNSGHNYEPSERFIEDGSFLRLRSLQIGYDFQPTVLQKIQLSSLRVYVNATNLVTWTNYTGFNPEITNGNGGLANNPLATGIDNGVYPIARTLSFGLNIGL